MTLSKLGKSLILITVSVTTLFLVLPASFIPLGTFTRVPLAEEIGRSQEAVLYVILGSSLMIALTLLVFVASMKQGLMSVPNKVANSLVTLPRSVERKDLIVGQSGSKTNGSYSPGAPPTVAEPYKKGEEWGGEFSLAGSTLKMYWSLLSRRNSSVGLRAIQRELGFSSPSSAVYQLEKLMKLGLVSKDEMGDYVVHRIVKVGFLREFLFLGKHALPKNALYGTMTLLVNIICYALLVVLQVQFFVVCLAVLPGLISASLFWHDAAKTLEYKNKLTERRDDMHKR